MIKSPPEKQVSDEKDQNENDQRVTIQGLTTFGIAIIFHSFVEGMAMGVYDEISSMTILAVSIILHKIPVAAAVGATFEANG